MHTGVKSAGCENRTAQLLSMNLWKSISPWVVLAWKFGAVWILISLASKIAHVVIHTYGSQAQSRLLCRCRKAPRTEQRCDWELEMELWAHGGARCETDSLGSCAGENESHCINWRSCNRPGVALLKQWETITFSDGLSKAM